MAIKITPEIQANVDAMPPLTATQIARLRVLLHDWPAFIRDRLEARGATTESDDSAA